ncbi:MAG: hypothetical protein DWQ01_03075 [Planctomycetota bacterium]|nr:MAG: hypothetical protein DWQ01_03075 [Planctomycetota bacterium]
MVGRPRQRLSLALLLVFGGTAAGIQFRRSFDGVLRVEGWSQAIVEASQQSGLGDPSLLAALVYSESRGRADALSSVGARGLCQLKPATAAEVAMRLEMDGPPFTPEQNLLLGATYLREMMQRWQGNLDLALLAYRMGPTAVSKGVEKAGGEEAWLEQLRRRKPSPWEYRTKVLRYRRRFEERGRLQARGEA